MRIGCLQFAPQVADVTNNIHRAEAVLSKADPEDLQDLDLLVLPEMAFSGYNFKSVNAIEPYLEPTSSGVSSQWARTTALKYGCTVAVGYPERADVSEYYNSLAVINSRGKTEANYRKSFLYYTDETWAREGHGFYGGEVGSFGQVAMGICMDINPYKFEAPWQAYEFAFHILKVQANLVIFSMAWLTNDDRSIFLSSSHEPDLSTITYWVRRLEPVIRAETSEEIIFVFCNRSGVEDEATYAGTSTVIGIKDGDVSIYGLLSRGARELLVVDTDKPPFAKLVDRPAPPTEEEEEEDSAPLGEPPRPPGAEPPKDSDQDSGSPSADSPTLPSTGFAPLTRTHTQPETSPATSSLKKAAKETASQISLPQTKQTPTRQRPKLSLLTNPETIGPILTHHVPTPAAFSNEYYPLTPSSPSPSIGEGTSKIPILVDIYTPDAINSNYYDNWPDHDMCFAGGLDEDDIRFTLSACSSWSACSSSSLSASGSEKVKKHRISIAASPSIFGGGLLAAAAGVRLGS